MTLKPIDAAASNEVSGRFLSPTLARVSGADKYALSAQIAALQRASLLPANVADFPLAEGQHYGLVGTNGKVTGTKSSSSKSGDGRTRHLSRTGASEAAFVAANWYVNRDGNGQSFNQKLEFPNEAEAIYGFGFEMPSGTFQRMRSNRSIRGRVAADGWLTTDFLPVSIAENGEFWAHTWSQSVGSLIAQATQQSTYVGEGLSTSSTAATDTTMVTAAIGAAATASLGPVAIIGRTTEYGVAVVDDSIGEGVLPEFPDEQGVIGLWPRAIEPYRNFVNLAVSGDRAAFFIESCERRLELLQYCGIAACGDGTNDIAIGATADQLKALWVQQWTLVKAALIGPQRVVQRTLLPRTTSTDSFRTRANQTPVAGFELNGYADQCNAWLRAGAPLIGGNPAAIGANGALLMGQAGHPLAAIWDVRALVQDSVDPNVWSQGGRAISDAAMASGSTTLTSATASFTSADVGELITVAGAGASGATLVSYIRAVNSGTSVTLHAGNQSGGAVSGAAAVLGTATHDGVHPSRRVNRAAAAAFDPAILGAA